MPVDSRTLRHAIVANVPVLVICDPHALRARGFGGRAGRHRQGLHAIVLHDPMSAGTLPGWSFDDITIAALAFTAHKA